MKNLKTYFEIPFDDRKISDDELRLFSEDHLRRLGANNPDDALDDLLSATGVAYSAFFGAISDEDTNTAVRRGMTKTKDVAMENFKTAVSRREGTVRGAFGKNSAEYLQFFPQGVSEYLRATLGNVEMLMDRLVAAAHDHAAQLGPTLETEFVALRTALKTARGAQLSQKGAVSGDKEDAATARTTLERQLTVNLLTLALRFVGDPDKAAIYFDQSLLREDETTPVVTPTA